MRLILAALLFAPLAASGQDAAVGSVSGTVTGAESGEHLIGTVVRIVGTSHTAVADVEGRFSFSGVPTGTHEIETFFAGYVSTRVAGVEVKAREETVVRIEMEPDATLVVCFPAHPYEPPLLSRGVYRSRVWSRDPYGGSRGVVYTVDG